jgi:hypothetical protein
VSLLFVGILSYLYTPFNIDTSKFISQSVTPSLIQEKSPEVLVLEETEKSNTASKRIRLTNLLLRYQKQMTDLESSDDSISTKQEKFESLRQKIENLELMITEISQ